MTKAINAFSSDDASGDATCYNVGHNACSDDVEHVCKRDGSFYVEHACRYALAQADRPDEVQTDSVGRDGVALRDVVVDAEACDVVCLVDSCRANQLS